MNGLSIATVLEIFTHPNDLEFYISPPDKNGKHAIVIMRGPGHNFKILVSSNSVFVSVEDAADALRRLIIAICEKAAEILKSEDGIFSEFINPQKISADRLNVIKPPLIEKIHRDLHINGVASTWK